MDSRQQKRANGDLRHWERNKRLQKLLAAKSKKPQTDDQDGIEALAIGVGPGLCTVLLDGAERTLRCEVQVVPGDRVFVRHEKVVAIGARRTTLARTDPANPLIEKTIAANLDLIVIVASMADPPFRPGLIDRYLIAAARGGISPILCINKVDRYSDTSAAEAFRIPVVRCSALTGAGAGELRELLAGNLSALVGHSGVGKSSLLNALAAEHRAETGRVNDETGKGRHTTSSSRLYRLSNGARIIDTPGIREFGLGRITLEELRTAFPEFDGLACRFRDCSHREEPDCEVRKRGGPRYGAYLRLAGEL